jgi:DNA-binding GntR family transcriptional regulator
MKKISKKELAYTKIKSMILEGSLEERADLSENIFARKLNMSRTPVREALQRLQMEGFIKIFPNKGIVVQDISMEDVREIYDLRIALEEFVVREVAPLFSDTDIEVLNDIMEEQVACLDPVDPAHFLKTDRAFHEFIFHIYGNSMIIEFMKNLRERIYLSNFSMLQSPDNMRCFYEEHVKILNSLSARDGEGAARNMDQHLKGGKMRLMNL